MDTARGGSGPDLLLAMTTAAELRLDTFPPVGNATQTLSALLRHCWGRLPLSLGRISHPAFVS